MTAATPAKTETNPPTSAFQAIITGRGADSEASDRKGAVDASIFPTGGEISLFSVTLLPRPDGSPGLTTWGCVDQWCSNPDALRTLASELVVQDECEDQEDYEAEVEQRRRDLIGEIVASVEEAASRE